MSSYVDSQRRRHSLASDDHQGTQAAASRIIESCHWSPGQSVTKPGLGRPWRVATEYYDIRLQRPPRRSARAHGENLTRSEVGAGRPEGPGRTRTRRPRLARARAFETQARLTGRLRLTPPESESDSNLIRARAQSESGPQGHESPWQWPLKTVRRRLVTRVAVRV